MTWPEACTESERLAHLLEFPLGGGLMSLARSCGSLAGMNAAAEAMLVMADGELETGMLRELATKLLNNCANDEVDLSDYNNEQLLNGTLNFTINNLGSTQGE